MKAMKTVLAGALLAGAPVLAQADTPALSDVRVHVAPGGAGSSKSLSDSAADLTRALSKVPGLAVVSSADDADVLVQVNERNRARTGRVVPIFSGTTLVLLPVRDRQVVASVSTPPHAEARRADTLSGRHRRTWNGAAEDLARQIGAWSRP